MHRRGVRLIVKWAQQPRFEIGRVAEQREGLIPMAGEDRLVEFRDRSIGRVDLHLSVRPHHPHRLPPELHAVAHRREDLPHIALRAAADRPPLVLRVETEESVIVPEPQQRHGGKGVHFLRRRAPDRAAHRHKVEVIHVRAVVARLHVFAQTHVRVARIVECGNGFLVESVDGHEHAPMPGTENIPPLAEKQIQASAIIFEMASGRAAPRRTCRSSWSRPRVPGKDARDSGRFRG